MTTPTPVSVTEIAKVVTAAFVEYRGDSAWDELTEREQAVIEHGVRVVQVEGSVQELCRQVSELDGAEPDWNKIGIGDKRDWHLFYGIVTALSTE